MRSACCERCDRRDRLTTSIINEDTSVIANCKGIGKKTAERIILELKDKIKPFDYILPNDNLMNAVQENTKALEDALIVLTSLGLSKNDATKKAKEVMDKNDTAEQIVAKVLHDMGN